MFVLLKYTETNKVRSTSSPTGICSRQRVFEVLWNLAQTNKYVRILLEEICRNLDRPPKNKELWSYVVKFELVGRK